jgi:glycosyltransferase involved in cell wall biosynthesis/GT2 family glycosyltransferase
MREISISVVINTLNRGHVLGDTIKSLKGLRYSNFEVIVVNGPSTDGTQTVLDEWEGCIKSLNCAEANLSMSRNVGIAAAAGDIVAFIDDDASPHPNWLTELARPYIDPNVAGVGGFTIDNTGVRFQARKTICDRFGNAYCVSPYFDERSLCIPGSPFYPSLLGTNSSFRRQALERIAGFDHVFAYFLDETDVCLRLIDAGHQIQYAPEALVFHQFEMSHIRNARRVPKTLYPSVVSKSYFIMRHGASEDVDESARQLEAYRKELNDSNKWLCDHSEISVAHRVSLDQDVAWGIATGTTKGMESAAKRKGDLTPSVDPSPFLQFSVNQGLCIALISQSFPPVNEAGIARWTSMMAKGLAERGHNVHVIARADGALTTHFADGYWVHRIASEPGQGEFTMMELDLPPNIANWAEAVKQELRGLRTFGLDVVSFPIWDIEGVAIADDQDIGVVMSLHTSYAIAKQFKREWMARPLYEHFVVNRIIRHERALLERVPVILANSHAIVEDLTTAYGVDFSARAIIAPHGTYDPFVESPERRTMREKRSGGFLVAFVGRFETRKGVDIAAKAIAKLLAAQPDANALFVGDDLTPDIKSMFAAVDAKTLLDNPRARFVGQVPRRVLDDLYSTCDVVLMPSRYESFGLVAIEAMAAGAVVIALATGGLKEIVRDGKTGYLAPLGDQATQACASRLIALARDPASLKAMSAAARADFEERFSVAAMVAEADAAYLKAANLRKLAHVVESGAGGGGVSSPVGEGAV